MSERIYYDGDCGLCHWAVEWVARRDPAPKAPKGTVPIFRFAPLGGSTFARVYTESHTTMPDSMAVETERGDLLWRSDGVGYILRRLGGGWGVLGRLMAWVPRLLRDGAYDLFARLRHRWVARPDGVCPMVPPEIGRRFDP